MPRFEYKKFVQLPTCNESEPFHSTIFMVGRFVGTAFRKVVTFTDYRSALKFCETYSGIPQQMVSDFVIYQFDLSVGFPLGYDPKPAQFGDYYKKMIEEQ